MKGGVKMSGDFNYNTVVGSEYGSSAVDYSIDPTTGVVAAIFGGIILSMLLIGLAFHVYLAICLIKIAKKTNTPNEWYAWVPVLNIILMLQIAKKPVWWFLMFFIPFANIIFSILIWMEIAKRVNKPDWWGILIIVPFINFVVPGFLAFSEDSSNSIQPAGQKPIEPQDIGGDSQETEKKVKQQETNPEE